MSKLSYRPDIDGLRAIAVLAVVLYHLQIGPFIGGFVGVDIFFVISGYLITGIIQREIEQDRFTFPGFYERRVRRLFPALFVVLLATLLLGAWLLLPSDLAVLGKSAIATIAFVSNMLFWRSSGYFDPTSELNPLLHMWSLAVEEQFYIGLPILLLLIQRFARQYLRLMLSLCAAISLLACIVEQSIRPTMVFYLLPFRAWELLLGALLAAGAVPEVQRRWLRETLSVAAMLMLTASLLLIKTGTAYPGWQAIFPVLGTAILLHVGSCGDSTMHRLLRLKPIVFVGMISYSLYLWHWPVLVYAKYVKALAPLGELRGWLLALSLALATASYRWVEQPFRRAKGAQSQTRLQFFVRATALACLLVVLGMVVRLNEGMQFRVAPVVAAMDAERTEPIPFSDCDGKLPTYKPCWIGADGVKPSVLIWGDSHAAAWAPALDRVLKAEKRSAVLATISACPPLIGVNSSGNHDCYRSSSAVAAWLASQRLDAILMIASWLKYSEPAGPVVLSDDQGNSGNAMVFPAAFARTIERLKRSSKKILVFGPTPGAPSDVLLRLTLAARFGLAAPLPKSVAKFRSRAGYFWGSANTFRGDSDTVLVDPSAWFCNATDCVYEASGRVLYRDGGHLNLRGAAFIEPYLRSLLDKHLTSRPTESISTELAH